MDTMSLPRFFRNARHVWEGGSQAFTMYRSPLLWPLSAEDFLCYDDHRVETFPIHVRLTAPILHHGSPRPPGVLLKGERLLCRDSTALALVCDPYMMYRNTRLVRKLRSS